MTTYVKDQSIAFTFDIAGTASPPANLDIRVEAPDGTVSYDEAGTTHSASYTSPPDVDTDGSYTFSKSFNAVGNWTLSICSGISTSFTVHSSRRIYVTEHTATYNVRIAVA